MLRNEHISDMKNKEYQANVFDDKCINLGYVYDPDQAMLKTFLSLKLDKMVKKLAFRNALILDVGCSYGYYSAMLLNEGYKVIGIDISNESLKSARKYCSCFKKCEFYLQDAENLKSFKDNCFDGALCMALLEHLDNPQGSIREISRTLKRSGKAIFNTVNTENILTLDWFHKIIFPSHWKKDLEKGGHKAENFFSTEELKIMLEKNGFKVLECIRINVLFSEFYDLYFFPRVIRLFQKKNRRIGNKIRPSQSPANQSKIKKMLVNLYNLAFPVILSPFLLIDWVISRFGQSGGFIMLAEKI
jgi:ubiquinone biosynthesis O-methyltransferase